MASTPAYPYHAARRAAATARTMEAIVAVGKDAFERRGWSGATMRGVPGQAGVSVKTAEAPCRTKAELLKQAVDYAIAGDLRLHRDPRPQLIRLRSLVRNFYHKMPLYEPGPPGIEDRPVPPTPEGHVPTRAAQPANQHSEQDDLQPRYTQLAPEPAAGFAASRFMWLGRRRS